MAKGDVYAPGMRIVVRDEEWLVRAVETEGQGRGTQRILRVVGTSPLVRDVERIFVDAYEKRIEIFNPLKTKLKIDSSRFFLRSRLFVESLLRQTPPTDEFLHVGYGAAIDSTPFQREPALVALRAPRQRILIADAVGLGKTIECGILLTELIKRGKGKRILVLAVKSMMTQFQKELWARFTIPLVRLDSVGIQRVRERIPTNHNPFNHFDKTIISIDTLKETHYRNLLENCRWDVIVVDEAHNVAERATNSARSQRSRLAKTLASRCDSLIMLSATPHDGRKRSFASLMTMLNPTSIVDPENYGPKDVKGLFVRRFKKDVKDQIADEFPEREVFSKSAKATAEEESAFEALTRIAFRKIDRRKTGNLLFKTTLEKALFSGPDACRETLRKRLRTLEKDAENDADARADAEQLRTLDAALDKIEVDANSKYSLLKRMLNPKNGELKWNPNDADDRVVVFTERLATMRFLAENLRRDLGLKAEQIATLDGSMSDVDTQEIVEKFGNETSKIRLLICTDVASEGINLHYFCHRLIHYDVPWSLTVFQQRNGRVDRYGQSRRPEIYYLSTESAVERIKGDARVLELLIQKDKEVVESIGDPSEFTRCFDVESEEAQVAEAMSAAAENPTAFDEFAEALNPDEDDFFSFLNEPQEPVANADVETTRKTPSLFASDFRYAKNALEFLKRENRETVDFDASNEGEINLTPPDSLLYRMRRLPKELIPEEANGRFRLCDDRDAIKAEIRRCRESEGVWTTRQLLWEQHPVLLYLNDVVATTVDRGETPVIALGEDLPANEAVFLVYSVVSNRRGGPILCSWIGVRFRDGKLVDVRPLEEWLPKLRLNDEKRPNPYFGDLAQTFDAAPLEALLKDVVREAERDVLTRLTRWEKENRPILEARLNELETLKKEGEVIQEQFDFGDGAPSDPKLERLREKKRNFEKAVENYKTWLRDAATPEKTPYVRIVAVAKGGF